MEDEISGVSKGQSCKEDSSQHRNVLKQIKNFASKICSRYARDYDGLDQSLFLIFYLNAIVLIFIVLFITKELSLGKDNEEISTFVQDSYVDVLLTSYLTPAILWTICLFLIKDDNQILVFDNNAVSYKRPLFYLIYVFGAVFFLTDILQVAFHLRCGIAEYIRSLYLCVEAVFVFTQLLFQVLFLNATFLARSSAKLTVIHMIGTNVSVFIHATFRKSSLESFSANHTKITEAFSANYCTQAESALSKIMDNFHAFSLQFIVVSLVNLVYIFNNIRVSQDEIQHYSPVPKMVSSRRNLSVETSLGKSGSEFNSGSSISLLIGNISPNFDVGLIVGLFLGFLILVLDQIRTGISSSELIIVNDLCHVAVLSAMLCFNWLISWVLYNFYPYYDWMAFTPTEETLVVGAVGYFASNTLRILVYSHYQDGASFSFFIKSGFRTLLGFLQTCVIIKIIGHPLNYHSNTVWRRYMAEALIFLAVCNSCMALHETFFATTKVIDNQTFFYDRTWTILTSLAHPFEVLYFFHSAICFLDISSKFQS